MDAATLQSRIERERKARVQAEALLDSKSLELFEANSELISANDALAAKSMLLDTILDRAVMGFFLVDEQFSIVRANRAAATMISRAESDLVGLAANSLLTADSQKTALELQVSLPPADQPLEGPHAREVEAIRADGTVLPIELAITPIDTEEGPRTVWLMRDLTRRRKAEAERVDLERELSQAQKLEAMGTLASGIAHEINTPVQYVGDNVHFMRDAIESCLEVLAAYDAFFQTLPDDGQDSPEREAVVSAKSSADIDFLKEELPGAIEQALEGISQISKIVTAIKEFSHPGVAEKTAIDLNSAIETTITISRNQWKYVADLEASLDPELPPVPCLPSDINQVILNLIVNAAHAIEENPSKDKGKIFVETEQTDDFAEIHIGDTGCGISIENQKKIFDPFFTTKEVGKGTGQGLSIAHGIVVKKHGGEIICNSGPNVGTVFTIRLPLTVDQPVEAAE